MKKLTLFAMMLAGMTPLLSAQTPEPQSICGGRDAGRFLIPIAGDVRGVKGEHFVTDITVVNFRDTAVPERPRGGGLSVYIEPDRTGFRSTDCRALAGLCDVGRQSERQRLDCAGHPAAQRRRFSNRGVRVDAKRTAAIAAPLRCWGRPASRCSE